MSIQVKLPNESITLLPLGQDMWEVQTAQGTAQKTSELVLQELKNRPIIYVSSNEDREKLLAALKPSSNDEVMEIAEEILPICLYNQDNLDSFIERFSYLLSFEELKLSIKNDPINIFSYPWTSPEPNFYMEIRDNKISVYPKGSNNLLLEVPIERIKNRTIQSAICDFCNTDALLEGITFDSVTFDNVNNTVFSNCALRNISVASSVKISIESKGSKIIAKRVEQNPEDDYFAKFFELSTKTSLIEVHINNFLVNNVLPWSYLINNSLIYINKGFLEVFLKKLNDIQQNGIRGPDILQIHISPEKNDALYYLYFCSSILRLYNLRASIRNAVFSNLKEDNSFKFKSSDLTELYLSNIFSAEIFLNADNPNNHNEARSYFLRYNDSPHIIQNQINPLKLDRFKKNAIENNLAILKNKDLDLKTFFEKITDAASLNNFLQILIEYPNDEGLIRVRKQFSEYIKRATRLQLINLFAPLFAQAGSGVKPFFNRLKYLCQIKDVELQDDIKNRSLISIKDELNIIKEDRSLLIASLDNFNHQVNEKSLLTELYDTNFDEKYKIKLLEVLVEFLDSLDDEYLAPLIPSLLDVLSREKFQSHPFVQNFIFNKILTNVIKTTDVSFVRFHEKVVNLVIQYLKTHDVSLIIAEHPNLIPQLLIYGLSLNEDDSIKPFFTQLEERYFSDPAVAPFIEAATSHNLWTDEKTMRHSIHQSEVRIRLALDLLMEVGLVNRAQLEELKQMELETLKGRIDEFRTLFNQLVEKHSAIIRNSNPTIDPELNETERSFLAAYSSLPPPKKLTVLNRSFLSTLFTEKKQLEDKQNLLFHLAEASSLIFLSPDLKQALVTDRKYVALLTNMKDPAWETVQIFSMSRKRRRDDNFKIEHLEIHYENPKVLQKAFESFPLFLATFIQFLNRSIAVNVVISLKLPDAYHRPLLESLQAASAETKWTSAQNQNELCDIFVPFFDEVESIRPIPSNIVLKPELLRNILTLYGEASPLSQANYLFVLAAVFAKASSASFFGTHNDSPDALRAFSLALFNEALKLNPNLIENAQDIRNRLTGEDKAFTCTDVLTNIMIGHCAKSTSKGPNGEPSLAELYEKYFPLGWRSRYH